MKSEVRTYCGGSVAFFARVTGCRWDVFEDVGSGYQIHYFKYFGIITARLLFFGGDAFCAHFRLQLSRIDQQRKRSAHSL